MLLCASKEARNCLHWVSSLGNPDQTCRQGGLEQSKALGAVPIQVFHLNCRDVVAPLLQVPFLSWQSLLKTRSKCFFSRSKLLSFSSPLISALCGSV